MVAASQAHTFSPSPIVPSCDDEHWVVMNDWGAMDGAFCQLEKAGERRDHSLVRLQPVWIAVVALEKNKGALW